MLRGGLADEAIEVTVPLTPTHLAYFSWRGREKFAVSREEIATRGPYRSIGDGVVEEINRRTRHYCDESFVTHTRAINPIWFETKEPEAESGQQ